MALPQIIARNAQQKILEQSVKGNSNIIGTTIVVLYTVPSGKKAIITSASFRLVSVGANTDLDIDIGNERFVRTQTTSLFMVDLPTAIGKELDAGDTIELMGDSGSDNGSMNFFFTFKELPA